MNRYIGKIKKGLVSLCLTGALLVSSVAVAALPEIIGLKELQPGMWGTGYTVIDASGEIRPFDVQVVGILGDNSKMSAKRILVNLSGPLIEETGGAISGMSGSPIYFNGRLAGALSAGYKDMYPTQRIMLTPIEDMLKIWDYPDT
ncbi:MAG: SpoIVB peptidase S55 domain-containing protein [Anaerovibrio sp.]|nr:SpoIVB peptidase S55 domain-containing protein [Anaerovibrio sp.]